MALKLLHLADRKYTVVYDTEKSRILQVLRHGQPWRDVTGDNLIHHLVGIVIDTVPALEQMREATDELMTEFVSKKRAADWGVINQALLRAGNLLRQFTIEVKR